MLKDGVIMDWNPGDSGLFTGQGTAWGPAAYSAPGAVPNAPTMVSPSQETAFNQTPAVQALQAQMRNQQATNTVGADRQAAAMGAGSSSAARAQDQSIASQSQQQQNQVAYNAALSTYNSQVQQAQTANEQSIQNYSNQLAGYKLNQGNYLNEKQSRNGALGAFGALESQY